ncbi:alcohol dehydrogenase-like regulatory protein ErcA [Desulfovibrio ferrophilus]|uniref:Alcohol dehydrogenase n=1 Tax=Desulfovibrio ferrophilus TaxID=241368 RepID=A0A2Z6B2S3_9BACT|nr:alcohol dehydrogenase-like regulatory protein ErcA [Desulfovibrio ferrophilus]BBD09834.1 alcohol dehydrogenase [Desulfovibrio ferrophilus]
MPADITKLRKFIAPEVIYGQGSASVSGQYAHNLGLTHCLVVTDPGVLEAGWTELVVNSLIDNGIETTVFSEVSPNPRDTEVRSGVDVFMSHGCDGIVAVGGGSPMDCAKGIGIMATNGQDILEFEGVDQVEIPAPPLICIPTTAGSSADVSQFAIINDTSRKVKIAIVSKSTVPDTALVDPICTTTMSPTLTAATGLDALTHAFEAYVSLVNSETTDVFALSAIRLVRAHLLDAIASPNDIAARDKMMLASMHAGFAFSNAILGAVHAMAHAMGGLLDSPHGDCNASLLPHVVRANFNAAEARYRTIAGVFVHGLSPGEALAAPANEIRDRLVEELMGFGKQAGIPSGLSPMGMTRTDIPRLASLALKDACMLTNPKPFTQAEVEAIYEQAL